MRYDFRKVFLCDKKNFNNINRDLTFFSSSGSPASRMTSGMMTTDYCCLTCGLPIMENTTSTTTCVKCAKLRTRRRNFAQPWTPGTPPGNHLNANQQNLQTDLRCNFNPSQGPLQKRRNTQYFPILMDWTEISSYHPQN